MDNDGKTIVTDLTAIKKSEKEKLYRDAANNLVWLIDHGMTKEEILRFLFKDDKNVNLKEVAIFARAIDTAIIISKKDELYKNNRELYYTLLDLQATVKDYYDKLVEAQKFVYKGKDGKDYRSSKAVDQANEDYKNQMYTENEVSKHI